MCAGGVTMHAPRGAPGKLLHNLNNQLLCVTLVTLTAASPPKCPPVVDSSTQHGLEEGAGVLVLGQLTHP